MHRQALELRETVLGQEHPDTLKSMNNLAIVLEAQAKFKQAEEMHRQALELRETVLGQEHPKTLKSMSYLAWTYWKQERTGCGRDSRKTSDGDTHNGAWTSTSRHAECYD